MPHLASIRFFFHKLSFGNQFGMDAQTIPLPQFPFQEELGENQDRLCHQAINFNFYTPDKFEAMF